jgi:hypothetical protein
MHLHGTRGSPARGLVNHSVGGEHSHSATTSLAAGSSPCSSPGIAMSGHRCVCVCASYVYMRACVCVFTYISYVWK